MKFKLTIIISTVLIFTNVAFSQSTERKIDSLLNSKFSEEGPGAVFLIAQNGKATHKKVYGKANLELNVPMIINNVFQIGSMTKQFTAVAILMLEQDGKLQVTDKISKYIPDFPNADNITIHHLLTHTSGIKDYTKMKSIWEISKKKMSPKELIDFFKNEEVDFKPGEKFSYNNSGYIVLGYIIEQVSGKSYEEFVEEEIFEAVGMANSQYASDREVIKNRAYGYHKKENYTNKYSINFSITYAAGSLMSTVDDLLKWQNALNNNILLNKTETDKAFRNYVLNNGEHINYGYGWHIKDWNGTEAREHGGSIFGFKSMGVYVPGKDTYVVGLSNCDCNSPTQITRDIAKILLSN